MIYESNCLTAFDQGYELAKKTFLDPTTKTIVPKEEDDYFEWNKGIKVFWETVSDQEWNEYLDRREALGLSLAGFGRR
jgi:hypothetical protein